MVGVYHAAQPKFVNLTAPCAGIRHLVWDAGYGFGLGAISASGWTVVGVSTALTVIAWITSSALAG